MPFYEYQCKSCGHELEAMQKVSDAPLKKCPHCGKSQLQRLMSAPVFRLKGGGWYETDFKGEQDNKRNLADKPDADAPKVSDSSSSESKADAKGSEESKGTESKGAESKGAESKGSDAKSSDSKASGAGSNDGTAAKNKSADKSADKAPSRAAKSATKTSAPQRSVRRKKSPAKARRRR
jgi:putative FmdB family regulatory protein